MADAAASIATLLTTSTAVIQLLRDVLGASQERIRLRDEIRGSIFLLEMLKDRSEDEYIREQWSSSIRSLNLPGGPLETYKAALESLTAKLMPHSRLKQRTQSLQWLLDKAEVSRFLSTVERHKQMFDLAIQNDHM